MQLKTFIRRAMAVLGCSAGLAACEAVPTVEALLQKEPAGKVSVGIRPVESLLAPSDPMQVMFYINNGTEASIEILPWGTPLEKLMTADRFMVTIGGETIVYGGPVVKRPAPGPDDYVTLASSERQEIVVSLSDGYDVTASGEYEIVLKDLVFQGPTNDQVTPVIVERKVVITRQ